MRALAQRASEGRARGIVFNVAHVPLRMQKIVLINMCMLEAKQRYTYNSHCQLFNTMSDNVPEVFVMMRYPAVVGDLSEDELDQIFSVIRRVGALGIYFVV